ncbi:MAG: hypothetical protein ACOC7T_01315 [Planctomycetota bacterium]
MPKREAIENLRVRVGGRRDEAEALARAAMNKLARLVSGATPLEELDPDEVRAAAETFAEELTRLRAHARFVQDLRELLL